jgi:hypothetical protein
MPLNDTTNGFKAYRREVIDGCRPLIPQLLVVGKMGKRLVIAVALSAARPEQNLLAGRAIFCRSIP